MSLARNRSKVRQSTAGAATINSRTGPCMMHEKAAGTTGELENGIAPELPNAQTIEDAT